MHDLPVVGAAADPAAVTAQLLADGHGDGLPVVPPTAGRVTAMLDGVTDPDAVLGEVPPLFGELTVRAVAWYAVLAGCARSALPVVVAAARAALEPSVNLLGIATTTGAPAVGVLVHGGADAGFSSGTGGLGRGCPVNTSAGRAVSLALAGLGGGRPGVVDMSTHGQSAELTCCTAEVVGGTWPSLAVRRGLPDQADAVTVHGVGSVVEALPGEGCTDAAAALAPVAAALAGVTLAAGDPRRGSRTSHVLLVPPELAAFLSARGWDPERISSFLVGTGDDVLRAGAAGLASVVAAYGADDVTVARSAADVHVVESGGAGAKLLLLAGWSGGSRAVTAPVVAL